MKKFFTLFAFVMMVVLAQAATKTMIIDGSKFTTTATTQYTTQTYLSDVADETSEGITIGFSSGAKKLGSNNASQAFTDKGSVFIGKAGAYIYNVDAIPGKITKFEIYANYGASAKVSVGVNFSSSAITSFNSAAQYTYSATLSKLNSVYDCTSSLPDDAKYFWFQVTNANNAQVQFRITYETGSTPAVTVATPAISGTTPFDDETEVTMSCETTGASIYYTLDGATPSANSSLYNGAFDLNATTTVKAIAILDGTSSSVATKEFVKNEPAPAKVEVATVAALNALADNVEFKYVGTMTVSGQTGKYLFAQDATAGTLIYGTAPDYAKGAVIPAGWSGKKVTFNGAPEVTNMADMVVATETAELVAKEMTPAQAADRANFSQYGVLKNVTINTTGKKLVAEDGSEIAYFNRFSNVTVPSDAAKYDAYIITGYYNGAQVYPVEFKQVSTPEPKVEVATVAALNALEDNTEFVYTSTMTVSGQTGSYLYAQDATAGTLIYGTAPDYAKGAVIPAGWSGKKVTFKGAPEVTNMADMVVATETAELVAKEMTPAQAADLANFSQYGVIKNVTINTTGKTLVAEDGSEIAYYDRFKVTFPEVVEGKKFNVNIIVGWYDNPQVFPVAFEEVVAPEAPKYSLVGYINGADYGSEADYENPGQYIFNEEGKLTVNFNETSYVFVKLTDNSKWFLSQAFVPQAEAFVGETATTTATMVNGADYGEKMQVPAGEVEITLTVTDENTVVLSYSLPGTKDPGHVSPEINFIVEGSYNEDQDAYVGTATVKVAVENMPEAGKVQYRVDLRDEQMVAPAEEEEITWSDYTEAGVILTQSAIVSVRVIDATGEELTSSEVEVKVVPAPAPEAPKYSLVGYINGADYGSEADSENPGQYIFNEEGKLTVNFNETSYVFVKLTDNSKWFLSQTFVPQAEAFVGETATTTATMVNGANYGEKMQVPAGEVEITLTVTDENTVVLSYSLPGTKDPEQETVYYVAGTFNEWNAADEDYVMTKNENGIYELQFSVDGNEAKYEFKVTDGTWNHSWPASNYVFTATEPSTVVITFNPETEEITNTVTPNKGTGINDITVAGAKAYKTIENGEVIIVKDGVKYNVMGQKK